ncbi:alpha/beta hydrolase [Cellulomonas sp. KRMCY2]|uniref:alpha/beta hydrolase n=1 Tax=Cellulomonas sp. KRMCY2 TaxID=1304865 RepID=UPI00045E73DF|nr:alpha/beta fold hydrolase [Cellulomonas sp. KRMCY2]
MAEVTITTPRGIKLAGTYEPAGSPGPAGLDADLAAPVAAPPGAAVLFAHGFLAERSSRGRADRLAAAYRSAGFATLTFDFSGCGASDDAVVTVGDEVEDLEAGSQFLADAGHLLQVVHAHSLGALVALRSSSPYVHAMVLTGPVAGPIRHPWQHVLSAGQLAELRATGRTTVPDDGPGDREENVISSQTLTDFSDVDQESLLRAVTCPVLLVHGGALLDGEEHPLLTRSRVGLPFLPAGSALEVVLGADHSLLEHTDTVARRALAWLGDRLAGTTL